MSKEVKIAVTVIVGNDESITLKSREALQRNKRLGASKGIWLTGIAAASFLIVRIIDITLFVIENIS